MCPKTNLFLFFQVFNKSVLGYLAYLKIEINKVSDCQQEILQMLNNTPNQQPVDSIILGTVQDVDYFISSWPINNHGALNELESKLSDRDFQKKVVILIFL